MTAGILFGVTSAVLFLSGMIYSHDGNFKLAAVQFISGGVSLIAAIANWGG